MPTNEKHLPQLFVLLSLVAFQLQAFAGRSCQHDSDTSAAGLARCVWRSSRILGPADGSNKAAKAACVSRHAIYEFLSFTLPASMMGSVMNGSSI